MIYTNLDSNYSVIDLGFDKTLTKALLSLQGSGTTPELSNVFTSGVAPKTLISGELISSLEQQTGVVFSGKTSFDNTETGYRLGFDTDEVVKFYIGTSSSYFNFDGTNVVITGAITATSGTIGGWTINTGRISAGSGGATVGLDSTVTAGDDIRIFAGSATMGSAPFRVTEAGVLTASSATITGTIQTATSGQRIVISGSDNKLFFYDSAGEVLKISIDSSRAIWVTGNADVTNAVYYTATTASNGFFYSSSANIAGVAFRAEITGATATTEGVLINHDGNGGYGMRIDTSAGARALYIDNSGASDTVTINAGGSIGIQLSVTGTNNGIIIDSTGTDFADAGILINLHSATNPTGIQFNISQDGAGTNAYAMSFIGEEVVSSAVSGTQNKKVRVAVGSAVYYIPLYDA